MITAKTTNGLTAKCSVVALIDNNADNPFADVSPDKGWEYPFVEYVFEKGYMTGKEELVPGRVLFDPNANLTRAEFVTILYSMEGKPSVEYESIFTDVPSDKWFTKAVIWAASHDIVKGKGDYFDPNGKATREELVAMYYKYAQYKQYDLEGVGDLTVFSDAYKISSWAVPSMQWAVAKGLISGKGDLVDPRGTARRSECAAMLKRFDETLV